MAYCQAKKWLAVLVLSMVTKDYMDTCSLVEEINTTRLTFLNFSIISETIMGGKVWIRASIV